MQGDACDLVTLLAAAQVEWERLSPGQRTTLAAAGVDLANAIPELDYLTQISFELYESETKTEPGDAAGDPNKSAYSIRFNGCLSSCSPF